MDPLTSAGDAIVRAGRRLGSRGLISAGEGNLSVRLDADRILVTPDRSAQGRARARRPRRRLARATRIARRCLANGRAPTSDLAIHLRRPRGPTGPRGDRPRAPARVDGPDPRRRGAGPGRPARDRPVPAAPAVPDPGAARQSAAGRSDRGGAHRRPGAARRRRSCSSATAHVRSGAIRPSAVDRLELVEVLCRTWRDALLIRAAQAALRYRGREPSPGSSPTEGR